MHATAQALVRAREYADELQMLGRHNRRKSVLRTHNLVGERGDPLPVYPKHMENGRSMAHGPDGLLPHLQEAVHAVEVGTKINAAMHPAPDFTETTGLHFGDLGAMEEAEKKKNDRRTSALDEMTDHPYGLIARASLDFIEEETPNHRPAPPPAASPLVPPVLARKQTSLILRAYRDHDHEATGLNATELRACLQAMGVIVDDAEAKEVIQTYDADGDGKIDAGELAKIVKDLDVLRDAYPMHEQERALQVPAVQRVPAPGSKTRYRPPGWHIGAASGEALAVAAAASASAAAAATTSASALAGAPAAAPTGAASAAAPEARASSSDAEIRAGDEGAGTLPATPELASIPPKLAPGTSEGTPLTSRAQVALEEVGGFIKRLSSAASALMEASAGDRSPRSPRAHQSVLSPGRAAAAHLQRAQSSPRPPQPVSV